MSTVLILGGGVAGMSAAQELGERGFRFVPGFYKHVTDTMSRIPYKDPVTEKMNTDGVSGNLVRKLKRLGMLV